MNSQNILTAFLAHSVDIEAIALIAESDTKQVQAAMRAEMLRLAGQDQPSVSAESAPGTARKVRAAASSPSPEPNHAAAMKRSPARLALAKIVEDMSDYPESLRNPLAKAQRAIYDALRSGPKTTLVLAPLTGLTSATVSTTLYTLRDKRIVRGDECMPVNWTLVE